MIKKYLGVGLSIVVLTSMSAPLFATDTINAHVKFMIDNETVIYEGDVVVPVNPDKTDYLGGIDVLDGEASIMDAVFVAAAQGNLGDIVTAWDANPYSGDPGAYITAIGARSTTGESTITSEDGSHGRYVGNAWEYRLSDDDYPTSYMSNYILEEDDEITLNYASYDFEW